MLIEEEDAAELKTWVVKRLENISDADSDVLADYVIALMRADTPESELRTTAVDCLEDFLKDNTATFVDEIFKAIHTKSYSPRNLIPQSASSTSPTFAAPSGPAGAYGSLGVGRGLHGGYQESRKRSYNDRQEEGPGLDSHYSRGERQIKQMRRGGRGGRADAFVPRNGRGGFQESMYPQARASPVALGFQNMPMPPPFDPNDPLATIMAMQAMGLPPLPGMPPLPQAGSPNVLPQFGGQSLSPSHGPRRNTHRERCRDYDEKFFCERGDACPYEHGTDRLVASGQDEYDPKNSTIMNPQATSPTSNGHGGSQEHRGNGYTQGRGRGDRGGFLQRRNNHRADFSQAGPNHDRSITTIVVEQIPEEKFDDQSVRDFFSEFGNIEQVTMQPYKRLALVKYDDYMAARRAYESPKVIFENRFVKVYWYKPGGLPTPPATAKGTVKSPHMSKDEGPPFDREKFERDAVAAQKKLEEKKVQMKDVEAKRHALEKQKEELAQKQAEEKRRLLEKLAAKVVAPNGDTSMTDATNGSHGADDNKVSAHTKALREKVAELEAEAKSLGLDSALSDTPYQYRGRGRGRGRGSYRGWEGFASGSESFRGNPRGRSAFVGRGGGKYNLDNRTKKVAVTGDLSGEKDEALRQYLLGVGEFEAIEGHPDRPDTQVVTFKDRPTAETFMYGVHDIPLVGKLDFAWFNAPGVSGQPTPKQAETDGDTGMGGTRADDHHADKGTVLANTEVDYDVAEDEVW
ncbi:hypothetical protein HO133_003083 [Letharia lupina]|uniref:RNA-binding protein n=1 Tax=Letharia lupina TaxID=560253 RepID=A0A8H6CBS9_9LECA|nr:uncharacterized protein HO133_003083 [Letharia lupina]KAF6220650.1 hypothetical protein HO133_003083 [Letharia lupina]